MKKLITTLLILLFAAVFFVKPISAVTTTISNYQSTISSDPFTIDVTISGAGAGTNYLRIDLYKPSSTNYFGETYNGTDWYKESDYAKYFPITIQSGTDWTGQIQGKFGNPTQTQYDGPGTYKMRVRRYTSSGSYNSTEANNNAVDISVNVSVITPTSEIIPSDTSSPTIENSTPTIEPTAIQQSTIQQSFNNVYISEVMVNPPDGENEWLEVYNSNDYEVNFENWYIDDIENAGSTPKKFSLKIPAKSYNIFDFTSSIFNNDGDSVRLLDFNQAEKGSFQYQSSEKGKTLGRNDFSSDSFCLQTPSKGMVNNPCLNPTSLTNPTISPTPSPSKSPTIAVFQSIKNKISPTLIKSSPTLIEFKYPGSNVQIQSGSVLGKSSNQKNIILQQTSSPMKNIALFYSLSFTSFSYSILSIISILLKLNR